MKIRKLTIKNFKNIVNLSMDNIPDLVVIAGPNGCGKTSIFEAIRVFKASMGPYTNQDMNLIHQEVHNDLGNFVALDKEESIISISFELSSNEKSYLKKHGYDIETESVETDDMLEGTIKITKSGGIQHISNSPPLGHILSHYDATDELGAIMYIPAFRDLPRGDIGNITIPKLGRTAKSTNYWKYSCQVSNDETKLCYHVHIRSNSF